jgi:hypothetical protein
MRSPCCLCIPTINSRMTEEAFGKHGIYRVIQEELPPLTELISEDILSKKCHIYLGPILNIYRFTFVIGNALL